jgi:hypothetical protein
MRSRISPSAPPSCQELALEYVEGEVRDLVHALKQMVQDQALHADDRLGAAGLMIDALELQTLYAEATQDRRDQRECSALPVPGTGRSARREVRDAPAMPGASPSVTGPPGPGAAAPGPLPPPRSKRKQ